MNGVFAELIKGFNNISFQESIVSDSFENLVKSIKVGEGKMYQLRKELGEGSYARCYAAELTTRDGIEEYACKVTLRRYLITKYVDGLIFQLDQAQELQILNEVGLQQSLTHQNIVRLYESYHCESFYYQIMDLCEFGTVQKLLSRNERFTDQQSRFLLSQILEGVNYLHSRDVVHLDLKPDNLFLTSQQILKIGDFGAAKEIAKGIDPLTVCGSPNYMPPELVGNRSPFFALAFGLTNWEITNWKAVDIYSVGCIFYQFLYGHAPVNSTAEDLNGIFRDILKNNIQFPERDSNNEILNIRLLAKDLISAMTNKNPAERLIMADVVNHEYLKLDIPKFIIDWMDELIPIEVSTVMIKEYAVKQIEELYMQLKIFTQRLRGALKNQVGNVAVPEGPVNPQMDKAYIFDYVIKSNDTVDSKRFSYQMASGTRGVYDSDGICFMFHEDLQLYPTAMKLIIDGKGFKLAQPSIFPPCLNERANSLPFSDPPTTIRMPEDTENAIVVAWTSKPGCKYNEKAFLLSNGCFQIVMPDADILLFTPAPFRVLRFTTVKETGQYYFQAVRLEDIHLYEYPHTRSVIQMYLEFAMEIMEEFKSRIEKLKPKQIGPFGI